MKEIITPKGCNQWELRWNNDEEQPRLATMSFAKNSTLGHLLSKDQEIKYQIEEAKYHLDCMRTAMQEAIRHLRKSKYHSILFKEELNNKFTSGGIMLNCHLEEPEDYFHQCEREYDEFIKESCKCDGECECCTFEEFHIQKIEDEAAYWESFLSSEDEERFG